MNPLSLIPPQYSLLAKGIAIAAVIAGLLWYKHSVYEHGYSEGAATVQAEYDRYRQELAAATEEREKQNALKAAEVKSTNESAERTYEASLATIAARNGELTRLLHTAQARSCGASLQSPKNITATPESSPKSWSQAKLDELLEVYDARCQSDSAQLESLIREVKAQLSPP